MRILLAEDDDLLGSALRAGLTHLGFEVDWVRDGIMAEREMRSQQHQAAVLDLGLPRLDGTEVLKRVRQANVRLPVLLLTARDAVADRVAGLHMGADDYVLKPVDLNELAARLHALIRRSHGHVQQQLKVGDITLDPLSRSVTNSTQQVNLSHREFDLLLTMMQHAGNVLTRSQLEQHLYSWGHEVESNAVEVHIHHLRRKLGSSVIETIRGVGYVMHQSKTST